jgi:tyrosine-protein phosphatase SIW14
MKRVQWLQSVSRTALSALLVTAMTLATFAGGKRVAVTDHGVFTVGVSNFGKVNEHYFRGAQPDDGQYEELAAIGVKTVVDLRDDAKRDAKAMAEHAGLRYINFPIDDKSYPAKDAAGRFLQIVNNPANWPVYVHCAGGRHRTGAMTAVYRMTVDGWDVDRAYREMKDYDFYTAWGHKEMKNYVYDYYRDLQMRHQSANAAAQLLTRIAPTARARAIAEMHSRE